jgi:hypothetical protein
MFADNVVSAVYSAHKYAEVKHAGEYRPEHVDGAV